ncbi:MAG: 5'/3'-nucleotidase SurE, partial [Anaerolineae bacterium]|nr:5'/3'-nucleotidase SurE [Anaerolineae bacterium]
IPGIAVSLHTPEGFSGRRDYGPAAYYARKVAEQVLAHGLPKNSLLSVNVPMLPVDEIKGIMITRQGLRVYRDELVERLDPRGRPYYWIGGEVPTSLPENGTDFGSLEAGYVSVTPLQLDLTDHTFIDDLKSWQWEGGS